MDSYTADARSDYHWQPQHLMKFATALSMYLWQFFRDGLQGDFQLISRLRLPLKFMVTLGSYLSALEIKSLQ